MKKVLKPGYGNKPIRKCPECSCEFLFDITDVIVDTNGEGRVSCPECEMYFVVDQWKYICWKDYWNYI